MNGTTLSPGDVVAGPSRTRPPSQPAASSKAAPGPTTRTLKQPMTLRVAESSIAGTGAQDKEEYFRALKRKAELARRVDKWMDRVMEETVDRGPFQKAVSVLSLLILQGHPPRLPRREASHELAVYAALEEIVAEAEAPWRF